MSREHIITELHNEGWLWFIRTPNGGRMGEKTIDKLGRHQCIYYKTENAAVNAAKHFLMKSK